MDAFRDIPVTVKLLVSIMVIIAFAAITSTAFNRQRVFVTGWKSLRPKTARIIWICWGLSCIVIFIGRLWGFMVF